MIQASMISLVAAHSQARPLLVVNPYHDISDGAVSQAFQDLGPTIMDLIYDREIIVIEFPSADLGRRMMDKIMRRAMKLDRAFIRASLFLDGTMIEDFLFEDEVFTRSGRPSAVTLNALQVGRCTAEPLHAIKLADFVSASSTAGAVSADHKTTV